jgi:hypothetical protein
MMRAALLLALLAVAGCASAPKLACAPGESPVQTAQMFVGSRAAPVSEARVRSFVNREVTPRFPDGVTVVDGGGQWTGDENRMIREANKVVLIVLPPHTHALGRMLSLRRAYRAEFRRWPVMVVPPPACASI